MSYSKTAQIFVLLFLPALFECLNTCGDWTQYKDTKCLKVIAKKATEEEAMSSCSQIDPDASLITIHSGEEQEFLNNLLHDFNSISVNAWLGLKYNKTSFMWIDGTKANFTNWQDDAIKDGNDACVQMSLVRTNLGKWLDQSCKRTALIVCQKKQVFNLNTLRTAFETIEKDVKSLKVESIPMGFLYTQLPNELPPKDMWPAMNWTDISEEYAGLFFRVVGNGSADFGQVQQSNQSWISEIEDQVFTKSAEGSAANAKLVKMSKGAWNSTSTTSGYGFYKLSFFTTEGEVRPKNKAIRIWKRIG